MKMKFVVCMVLMFAGIASAVTLDTVHNSAILLSIADHNQTQLDVNTTSWKYAKDWNEIPVSANIIKVKFYVYDPSGPNNVTFNYYFYLADRGCNAELIASGSAICGGAMLSHNPIGPFAIGGGDPCATYMWVDTLGAITTDGSWGVTTLNASGLNDVASFKLDRKTANTANCVIYNRSSSTATVYCVMYYY